MTKCIHCDGPFGPSDPLNTARGPSHFLCHIETAEEGWYKDDRINGGRRQITADEAEALRAYGRHLEARGWVDPGRVCLRNDPIGR